MANRIIQSVYDLKDNVSAKLKHIAGALVGHRKEADKTADAVDRDNKRVSKSYQGTANAIGGMRKGISSLGSSFLRITGLAGLVGSAFAAIKGLRVFGGAVESAVELEAQLVKTAALAGATAEQMERLKTAANDAGATYGVSAKETAEALTELVRASGDADAALAQLPATMQLAKTGGIALGDAATYVVQTLSQFNLAADKSSHVADVLAHEANVTLDSIEGVGDALSYAAPLAFQFGTSLEDTTSAIGALAQSGFRGSRAGTALARTFTQLIDPSSKFNAELKKLGIESTDFTVVINELAKRGAGARDALLSLGQRAGPAITALVNNGNAAFNDLRKSMQNVEGEAERTAKSFVDNFAGAQGKLASALDVLRRSIVEEALDPIKDGFSSAAVKIREFVKTAEFTKLTEAVKTFAAKGVKAVGDFIKSVDFAAATKRITAFLSGAGDNLHGFVSGLADSAKAVGGAVKLVTRFSGELITLGKVLLAVKLGKFAVGLGAVSLKFADNAKAAIASAAATNTAAAASSRYARVTGRLSGLLKGGLGFLAIGAAIAWTSGKLIELAQVSSDYIDQQAKLRDLNQSVRDQQVDLALKIRDYKDAYKDFADTAIASAEELASKTETQAQSYLHQLEAARKYYSAMAWEAKRAGKAADFADAQKHAADLKEGIAAATVRLKEMKEEAKNAKGAFSDFAVDASRKFDKIVSSGKSAAQAVNGLFSDIDFGDVDQLKNVAESVKLIGVRGTEAGDQIRDELRAQLVKLSDEDFKRFSDAAKTAFAEGSAAARLMKDATAGINLARLGVDLDQIKTGFTDAGQAAVTAFNGAIKEIDAAALTAEQRAEAIGQAVQGAIKKASASAELNALGAALEAQFHKGEISADAFAKSMDAVRAKERRVSDETRNTADAAGALTQNLNDAGNAGEKSNEQLAASAVKAGVEVQKIGDVYAQVVHDVAGAQQALNDITATARSEFLKTSEAATVLFDNTLEGLSKVGSYYATLKLGRAVESTGTGIGAYVDAVDLAAIQVRKAVQAQRDDVAGLTEQYANLGEITAGAFDGTINDIRSMEAGIERMSFAVENGGAQFRLLNAQDLSGLRSALDAARSKVEQLKNEAKAADDQISSIGASLQDQIDQIQGNQSDIEGRRYAEQLDQLEALAKKSGENNSNEYRQAIARAAELHRLKMQQLQEEAGARAKSEAAPTRSTESGGTTAQSPQRSDNTLTLKFDQRNVANINPDDTGQIARLARQILPAIMRELKFAAQRSGRSN